jgi:hypothetical protein
LSVVELLDLLEEWGISRSHKVDSCSFSSESSRSSNSVNVGLFLLRKVVVDDKGDLLDVNSSGEEVSGDENSSSTSSELSNDHFSVDLFHLFVNGGHSEFLLFEYFGEVIDFLGCVAIDDGLINFEVDVEVHEDFNLPFLLLKGHVVLLDTVKGELFLFDQNSDWISHEILRDLEDFLRHGCREESNLDVSGKEHQDLLDLDIKILDEVICLVEDKDSQVVSLEEALLHHVLDSSWSSHHNMHSAIELEDVVLESGSSSASVNLDPRVLSNSLYNFEYLESELSGVD